MTSTASDPYAHLRDNWHKTTSAAPSATTGPTTDLDDTWGDEVEDAEVEDAEAGLLSFRTWLRVLLGIPLRILLFSLCIFSGTVTGVLATPYVLMIINHLTH